MDQETIRDAYTGALLENRKPANIYMFCKSLQIEESEFFKYFASFDHIEQYVFESMAVKTVSLLEADASYAGYDVKTQLLSFYYTLFELLTSNRTLVTLLLKNAGDMIHNHRKLSGLRRVFFDYIAGLGFEQVQLPPNTPFEKWPSKSRQAIAWLQLMATLKFWLQDTSPSFEKTDIYIEKAVNASFDLMEMKPVQHLVDFAKFLWQERRTV